MAHSLRKTVLPPIPSGVITGEALRTILTQWQTLILAEMDLRDTGSDASGVLTDTLTPYTQRTVAETITAAWTFADVDAEDITADSVSATGAVAGATVAATGALSGASATVTGTASAGAVALTAATVDTTVGAAGAASALPAQPTGYLSISINGTVRKVPYYAT